MFELKPSGGNVRVGLVVGIGATPFHLFVQCRMAEYKVGLITLPVVPLHCNWQN
ncbi:hypothetical protein LDENG_00270040 [Lucifuga dentata]|nr:hypothetical protein LDENG_00270040 [Lucifuga dentata]